MLRSCVLSLMMLAGFIAAYIYWLDQALDPPASYWAGGIAGFFVLCCIGALFNAIRAWRDASRVAAAQHLDLQLVEGRTVTLCGTIHPVAEPLLAPFSNTPCIACEYDLTSQKKLAASDDQQNSGSDFAGFLMNPCLIRTQFRDVKLLGYPLLEGFAENRLFSYTAARNARAFLSTSEFDDRTGLKMVSVLSVFGDVWSDDDGYVRKNIRIGKVKVDDIFSTELVHDIDEVQRLGLEDPPALEEEEEEEEEEQEDATDDEHEEDDELAGDGRSPLPKMVEKRVNVGEQVCAIGVYDEVRGGLVPLSRGGKPNRLIRGDAESIIRKSRSSAVSNLCGGLIGLVVIHAALWGVIYAYTHSTDVIRERARKSQDAVRNNDIEGLVEAFRRGFNVNHQDSDGNTLLHWCRSPEITWWLIVRGADVDLANQRGDTPLMEAARYGRVDVIKQLLKAGADKTKRNSQGRTAFDEAEARDEVDAAVLLRITEPALLP